MIPDYHSRKLTVQALKYDGKNIDAVVKFTGRQRSASKYMGGYTFQLPVGRNENHILHAGQWVLKVDDEYFEVLTERQMKRLFKVDPNAFPRE